METSKEEVFGSESNEYGISDFMDKRELGNEAVWSISTAKPGNGVEQLRDNNFETYWQSDGSQPHNITIQFLRKMAVSEICLYLDYGLDESYAPKKISIRSGSTEHDLIEITSLDLSEPVGWTTIDLTSCDSDTDGPLRTHLLQIQVVTMHQNGRDTHVRQVKIFGPRISPIVVGNVALDKFHTLEMQQFAVLR
jgi:anaphase-promoting complex subunit 10